MTQHSSLTVERWREFPLHKQVIMIANEMHRASKLLAARDTDLRRGSYERVLRLLDLTVQANPRRNLRRELLRWRDLAAALYIAEQPDRAEHIAALKCLLLTTP